MIPRYWLVERQAGARWLAAAKGQGQWWSDNAQEALRLASAEQAQGVILLLEAQFGNHGMWLATEHEDVSS